MLLTSAKQLHVVVRTLFCRLQIETVRKCGADGHYVLFDGVENDPTSSDVAENEETQTDAMRVNLDGVGGCHEVMYCTYLR